jgi:hypothetical protein
VENIAIVYEFYIILFAVEQVAKEKNCHISHIKWIMREDADSVVVAASSDKTSCLQVWELREKALPVHKSLGKTDTPQYFNTVVSILLTTLFSSGSNFMLIEKIISILIKILKAKNN